MTEKEQKDLTEDDNIDGNIIEPLASYHNTNHL